MTFYTLRREHITQHPLNILNFAAKHGYRELGNEAARLSVALPMSDAAAILAADTFLKWVREWKHFICMPVLTPSGVPDDVLRQLAHRSQEGAFRAHPGHQKSY
jgi:hypothetical protein